MHTFVHYYIHLYYHYGNPLLMFYYNMVTMVTNLLTKMREIINRIQYHSWGYMIWEKIAAA